MQALNPGLYANLEDLTALRLALKGRKLKPQQKLWAQLSGSQHAVQKGRGMEFSEVRQYQPGDDIRTIDWRVTARTQKPHTKVFTEEQERPAIIALQLTSELFFGSHIRFKSVQALQTAALFAWLTLQNNDRIGGLIFNQHSHHWIAPKHHQSHVMRLLKQGLQLQEELTEPGQANPENWHQTLLTLQKNIKPGTQLILIGDLLSMNRDAFQTLHQLRRHADLIACHIYDRLERSLPHLGLVKLTNGKQTVQIDSEDPEWRKRYQQRYEQQLFHVKHQFLAQRVPFIELAADADPVAELLHQGVLQ